MITIARREALALLAAMAAVAACGGGAARGASRGAGGPSAPAASLALDPIVDLVPAAGLTWLVDARLRDLLGDPVLIPAVALLVPEARFEAFARRNGGVDLRQTSELAVEGRAQGGGITRVWGTVGDVRGGRPARTLDRDRPSTRKSSRFRRPGGAAPGHLPLPHAAGPRPARSDGRDHGRDPGQLSLTPEPT